MFNIKKVGSKGLKKIHNYYESNKSGKKFKPNPICKLSLSQHQGKPEAYNNWILKKEPLNIDLENLENAINSFRYQPKISIICPVWNTDEKQLESMLDSVESQTYPIYELCICEAGSTNHKVQEILKEYQSRNQKIIIDWSSKNQGISENSNRALRLATGDYVALLDHDDELSPCALFEVVKLLNQKPNLSYIYSDEDKIDCDGLRFSPFFKPEWSPDLILSCGYTNHLAVYRKFYVDMIGGFRNEYECSQDYDLLLRFIEKIDPSEIGHIPKILYHWRISAQSSAADPLAKDGKIISAAKEAIQDALTRRQIDAEVLDGQWITSYRVKRKILGEPSISIVIPTKDKYKVLKNCIESIDTKSTYQNYEIIIIDNGSTTCEMENYLNSINHSVLSYPHEFNFSKINNYAAHHAKGEYLIFLNNDTEVISSNWIESLLEHAQRPEIGAVGCKLLYPNMHIQHAGVILGMSPDQKTGVAGHWFHGISYDEPGYYRLIHTIRNYSAVTGACMMISKDKFFSVGGFEPQLAICYNDVDLCLKLMKKNYWTLYTPYAELFHHESFSRGHSVGIEEAKFMIHKWGSLLKNDPFFSVNLTLTNYQCDFNYD